MCQCGVIFGEGITSFRLAGECIDDNDNDLYGVRDVRIVLKNAIVDPPTTTETLETEECILGENVPFFTWKNFFIVAVLLIGFYFMRGYKDLNRSYGKRIYKKEER